MWACGNFTWNLIIQEFSNTKRTISNDKHIALKFYRNTWYNVGVRKAKSATKKFDVHNQFTASNNTTTLDNLRTFTHVGLLRLICARNCAAKQPKYQRILFKQRDYTRLKQWMSELILMSEIQRKARITKHHTKFSWEFSCFINYIYTANEVKWVLDVVQ